jgi:hypothetical protein
MDPLPVVYLANLFAALGLMSLAWGTSVFLKNAGVADIFWGLGFILVAWLTFTISDGHAPRAILLAVLTSIWGLRLAAHIWARNRGEPEDCRYRALREKEGQRFWYSSLYKVFWIQGVLLWVISLHVSGIPPWRKGDLVGGLRILSLIPDRLDRLCHCSSHRIRINSKSSVSWMSLWFYYLSNLRVDQLCAGQGLAAHRCGCGHCMGHGPLWPGQRDHLLDL